MALEKEIYQIKSFRNVYHKTTVNLIFTGKWIINLHNEFLKIFKLTLQQYNILRILKGQYPEAVTVKVIRERMLDKMSDASRIVENLRKKGLIARDTNTGDRRSVDVVITSKGLNLLNSIEEEGSVTMDNFLSKLSQAEAEQLNILLDKLRK